MRIIIGVDSQFVYHALKVEGQKFYFQYRELRDLVEGDGDEVLEMYAPVLRLIPASDHSDDVAKSQLAGDGVKHSDDQRLMIRLALMCTRLKPDFLVLIAGDGDYAPLVWGLREEGIRAKLISVPDALANDLRDAVYSVSNVHAVIKAALEKANAVRT